MQCVFLACLTMNCVAEKKKREVSYPRKRKSSKKDVLLKANVLQFPSTLPLLVSFLAFEGRVQCLRRHTRDTLSSWDEDEKSLSLSLYFLSIPSVNVISRASRNDIPWQSSVYLVVSLESHRMYICLLKRDGRATSERKENQEQQQHQQPSLDRQRRQAKREEKARRISPVKHPSWFQ